MTKIGDWNGDVNVEILKNKPTLKIEKSGLNVSSKLKTKIESEIWKHRVGSLTVNQRTNSYD